MAPPARPLRIRVSPGLQNGAAVGDPLLAPAEEKDQQTVRGQGEGAQGLPRPGVIRRQGTLEKLDGTSSV